jgi:hypothetical protein
MIHIVHNKDRAMRQLKFIAVILIAPMAVIAAHAQDTSGGLVAPEISKRTPGHVLDQSCLTSTGATVPRPGASQSGGTTPSTASSSSRTTRSTTVSATVAES